VNGKRVASLFQMTDEEQHKDAKRPVAHAYAMTTILDYEIYVDATSTVLVDRLTTLFAETNESCDFGQWLQWYAFDVIGEMTLGKPLGFLEGARDAGGLISTIHRVGRYKALVGQMPWLDYVLEKNPFLQRVRVTRRSGIVDFVSKALKRRLSEEPNVGMKEKLEDHGDTRETKDFLSKFIDASKTFRGYDSTSQLLGWSMSNINAGSDTTAISLRAIFCTYRFPIAFPTLLFELIDLIFSSYFFRLSFTKSRMHVKAPRRD